MPPRVSVIIPTKDRPHFLREAVATVFAQENADLELLVVNDGEDVPQLPKDNRLRILQNGKRGAVSARNFGLAEARGEYVAFLDDDDRWIDRNHLSRALASLRTDSDFTFADGLMQFPNEPAPRQFNRDATARSLEQDNTILISAVCYRRDLHRELGCFDEALPYYWDWDWYIRVARGGFALKHVAKIVVDIRIHAQNMSGDATREARKANLDAFAAKHGLGPLTLKNHTAFV